MIKKTLFSFLLTFALIAGLSSPFLGELGAQVVQRPASRAGGVVTTPLLAPDGTAAAPSYSFASDTNSGLYSAEADSLGLSAGGTARATLSTTLLTSTVPIQINNGSGFISIFAADGSSAPANDTGFRLTTGAFGYFFDTAVNSNNPYVRGFDNIEIRSYNGSAYTAALRVNGGNAVTDQTVESLGPMLVSGSTLGATVLSASSTATNDDPTVNVQQSRVATTDATVTTVHTIAIPATTTVGLACYVSARRTAGSAGTAEDGALYRIEVVAKNVAGTATEIAAETLTVIGESQAGWTVASTPSAGNILLQVTGAINNTITWHVPSCSVMPVGS